MKMNNISRKLIKPHTPTPENLKNYYVSFVDRYMLMMNFAVILFYESKPKNCIKQLEESLAKILVGFYPLAGRYMKNDHYVDCSDQGVEFVEAELAADDVVAVVDVVAKADPDQLNDLLPDQYDRVDEASNDPLMSIKATHLACGGLAIAISVSHRVFDGASLGTFVAAWSSATNPNPDHSYKTITPSFDLPSLLPYKEHDFGVSPNRFKPENHDKIAVKRLVFDKAALTSLKSKIRPTSNGRTVSDVRIVCAVIAKALIGMDRVRGRNRDIMIIQPVNMRERTIPAPPKHACGNLLITSLTPRVAAPASEEIGILEELVDLIGHALRKTITDHAQILSPNRDGRDIIINTLEKFIRESLNPETNAIVFSDWTKFGFYKADFGFGKPLWTSIGPQPRPRNNATVLMSNKEGDGIEAWLHINQNDVSYFDQDQEIKLFET